MSELDKAYNYSGGLDESARPAPRARQPSARSPPALQYSNHVQRYYLLAPEVEPEVVHTADMDSAHMRSRLHRALSWQQWSRPSRPAEHSHLRSHPPFEPKSSRSCCTTRPLRRRRRPACGACLSGERARVRAARPRAVRVPCMYRASGFLSRSSRGALMQPRQGSPWTPLQEVPQASRPTRPSRPPGRAWLHRRWWRAARP